MVRRGHVGLRPHLDVLAQPAHLRLRARPQLEAGALAEPLVDARQVAAHAGGERLARLLRPVAPRVEVAEEPPVRGVPRQHGEGRRVGERQELLALRAAGDQRAVAAGRQVGDRRPVELHAPLQVPREVPGRRDLRHHPAVQRDELVVDELDPGLADPLGEPGLCGRVLLQPLLRAQRTPSQAAAGSLIRSMNGLRYPSSRHITGKNASSISSSSGPPVVAVDLVDVRRVPARLGGHHVADDRAPLAVGTLVGRRAVERPAVVERRTAGRHLDRHPLDLGVQLGRRHLLRVPGPVVRRVELAAHRHVAPQVRSAGVVDRARVGMGLVERHPARRQVRRIEVALVGGVLVGQQRLAAGRLPHRVVDEQPHPRRALQPRGELGVARRERGRGDRPVGLPQVAELPRLVRRRDARLVVDLVGHQPGLPLVLEAAREVLAHPLHLVGREELLDDDEAVAAIGLDLLVCGLHARSWNRGAGNFYHFVRTIGEAVVSGGR